MRRPRLKINLRHVIVAIGIGFWAVYAGVFREYAYITRWHAVYAVMIVLFGLLPALVFLLSKREVGLIPLMPLHGFFYASTFGLTAISDKTDWLASQEDDIANALILTLLGLMSLYFGYYSSRRYFGKMTPIYQRRIPFSKQIRAAWILFGLFLSFYFFPVLRTLPSIEQLSTPLGYLSLGILAILAFDKKLPKLHFLAFIFALLFTFVTYTLSGFLAPAVFLLVFVGVLYWNVKRKIPWGFIFPVILLALFLNPVKFQYRDLTSYAENAGVGSYEKIFLFADVVQKYYGDKGVFESIKEDASTTNRLAHISTFGLVIAKTPTVVPYWLGDSYHTLWTSFIPRFLWPGKPEATIGQDFGHRYELLAPNDYGTSFNLPWLVEFYANFGVFGVFFGMLFVGFLFRALVQKFRASVDSPIEHALAVTIVFGLFYAESNFALMVGGLFSTYIALSVILLILTPVKSGSRFSLPSRP